MNPTNLKNYLASVSAQRVSECRITAILLPLLALGLAAVSFGAENNRCVREYGQARGFLAAGRLEQAVRAGDRTVAHCPGFYPAYVVLGVASQRLGRFQEAEKYLRQAVSVAPRSAAAYETLGSFYVSRHQPSKALKELQKAIRLNPHDEDYYLELGSLLEQYHANDAALGLFRAAVRILPGSIRMRSALAVAYMVKGKYSESEGVLNSVIASSPDYLPAYQLLGESYDASHDWEHLRETGEQLTLRKPQSAIGWYYHAEADYQLETNAEELRQAEFEDRKSLAFHPQFGPGYYLLGKILAAEKNGKEAVAAFKKAASLDDDPSIFYALAQTYRTLGEVANSETALRQFNQAVARKKAAYRKLVVKVVPSGQAANE